MPVYEWTGEKPLRVQGEQVVENGETFEAPEELAESFDNLVEETDGDGDADVTVEFSRDDEDEDDEA